jgi:hypothetical protein
MGRRRRWRENFVTPQVSFLHQRHQDGRELPQPTTAKTGWDGHRPHLVVMDVMVIPDARRVYCSAVATA